MSTVIRLKPGGRTHAPYYRVVVADSREKITGSVIEELGIYHPLGRPEPVTEIKRDRALEWLSKGAQPSDTVKNLLSKLGIWSEFKTGKPAAATATAESSSEEAPPAESTDAAEPAEAAETAEA